MDAFPQMGNGSDLKVRNRNGLEEQSSDLFSFRIFIVCAHVHGSYDQEILKANIQVPPNKKKLSELTVGAIGSIAL